MVALLARIIKKLDEKNEINFEENNEEEQAKLMDLLNILSYPDCEDQEIISNVFEGKKEAILPIVYFLLMNFEELRKRAYLGYFMVPISVPNEYSMDPEMRALQDEYQELVELFKNEHENYEVIKTELPGKEKTKDEITQLENEKDQLRIKLKTYQHDKTEKPEFQDLLKATTQLRRAQEDEAQLLDSLR